MKGSVVQAECTPKLPTDASCSVLPAHIVPDHRLCQPGTSAEEEGVLPSRLAPGAEGRRVRTHEGEHAFLLLRHGASPEPAGKAPRREALAPWYSLSAAAYAHRVTPRRNADNISNHACAGQESCGLQCPLAEDSESGVSPAALLVSAAQPRSMSSLHVWAWPEIAA